MQRHIKSYVLRAGRTSKRQQQAIESWTCLYELPQEGIWDLNQIFHRTAETIIEIGFGMGMSLFAMAKARPDVNFIGIEVHKAGVGSLVADLHQHDIQNVRIAAFDAVEVLKHNLADDSLQGVQIFFPDPWPKKRHHKRRLIQPEFIRQLVTKIKQGGFLHCATDWADYAAQMLAVLSAENALKNSQETGGYVYRPETRPLTRFEQRGIKLGHDVWDLYFLKQ